MQAIVETKPTKNELETGVYGETVLKSVFRINKKITEVKYRERERERREHCLIKENV